jgi:hypothetical protein
MGYKETGWVALLPLNNSKLGVLLPLSLPRDSTVTGFASKGSRVGPLRPATAHSQMSLRDGMNVRLPGGIPIPAVQRI